MRTNASFVQPPGQPFIFLIQRPIGQAAVVTDHGERAGRAVSLLAEIVLEMLIALQRERCMAQFALQLLA
ncbi:hypothetical protein AB4M04_25945, partial [Serratia quinivorans]